jgi:hypothetical protein
MPDLIQVANDLKDMPDSWLAQQMQNPSGSAPPWLVASEVARRERLRSGQAKAQAPASSVSQDLLKSLYAKIPPTAGLAAPPPGGPGGPAPPGMPPVNLSPGQSTMGTPPPGAAPPSSFKMPPRAMADGGGYSEDDAGPLDSQPDIYDLPMQQPSNRAQLNQLIMPPVQAPPAEAAPAMPSGPVGSASRMAPTDTSRDEIARAVNGAAENNNLPPELIWAVIQQESSGNPKAVSPKGARGLMQLTPIAVRDLGADPDQVNLDNPVVNIYLGARYLAKMFKLFNGDANKALRAYNAGPTAVQKYGGMPPYDETMGYVPGVLKNMNAVRAHYGLPQLDQIPSAMQSRLLRPTAPAPEKEEATARQLADAASPAPPAAPVNTDYLIPQPPATEDAGTDVSGPSDTAAAATSGTTADTAKEPPLNQTYTPPEPAGVTSLKAQIAAKIAGHRSVQDQLNDTYKQENLDLLKNAAKTLVGEPQDFSKYSSAIQDVMQMAKERMHPKLSTMLIQFGTALMASHQHRFLTAVGDAGYAASKGIQAIQEQGSKDYLTAARAGIDLQEKMDQYQAKVGQYTMARLAAQQTGIVADDRTWQTQLTGLGKELDTLQNKFNTSITSPYAQQTMAMALMNREHIVFDPNKYKDPITQLSAMGRTDLVQESAMVGKAGFTPKVQNPNQQTWESSIRTVAQANNIPLPDGPLNINQLPVELQGKVRDEYAKQLAKTNIATKQGAAEVALKDIDPEFVGSYYAQHGKIPPMGRSDPFINAKMWNMATDYLKQHNMTPMIAFAEQNAAAANKVALTALTKTTENVETFSRLADLNMNTLQGLASKVVDMGAPVLNTGVRDLAKQWKGDTRVSDMQVSLATVRAEVSKILNSATAAGTLTLGQKDEMERLLPDNYSYNMLVHALNVFRTEIANRRKVYGDEIKDLTQRTVVGQTGAGGQYRNLHKNGNITIGVGNDGKWHNVATGEIYP